MPEITVIVTAVMQVRVEDQGDAFTRVTGPEGDEFRAQTYGYLKTPDDVIGHWAYNAIANGYVDVCQLDGWADMDAEQITFRVGDVEVEDISWPDPAASTSKEER